jgi:plastocyanin
MSIARTTTARRLAALAAAVLLSCLALLAPTAPAHAGGHRVTMQGYAFSPSSITIEAGDTVTWTNLDTAPHDVAVTNGPDHFHSPLLSRGQSWSFTFRVPGSYSYVCSVHPGMDASLVVAAPAPVAVPAQPTATKKPMRHRPAAKPAAGSKATAAPAATTEQPDLNPLLLVAGVSVAVVIFCLLLLVSRPAPAVSKPSAPQAE